MAHPRSVADLDPTARYDFLFFWGHRPERDGAPGKGCLSQWWPAPFPAQGRRFPTAEHYMMWRKATLFEDGAAADDVLATTDPERAKEIGRRVRGFDQATWAEHRYDAVVAGNLAKFAHHDALRDYLLSTGDRVLVEASPVDRVWGIGLPADHPDARDPRRWRGLNLLGFALAEVRATLRSA